MTRSEQSRFRAALKAKRSELRTDIHSRMDNVLIDRGGDRMDEIRSVAERNATVEDVVRMSRLLDLVEEASERINTGSFGVCLACGEKVPRKRLELVPWTAYCVACQELSERAQQGVPALCRPFPESLAS